MKVAKRKAIAACGAGLATALIGVTAAYADPTLGAGENSYDRPLQGQGSDTTEEVMDALANSVTIGGNKVISSYSAKGGAFQSRSDAATLAGKDCHYTSNAGTSGYAEGRRADGSGAGRSALYDALDSTKVTFGCLDFARSSSVGNADARAQVAYIPLATDGLGFAITPQSQLPRQLTLQNLKDIYKCNYAGFNATPKPTRYALIPQPGSGTRSTWLGKVGVSEADLTAGLYPCVTDQLDYNAAGGPANPRGTLATAIQEHQGQVLANNSIVPISIAAYISQMGGSATDFRGKSILGTITDGSGTVSYPVGLNNSFGTVSSNSTLNYGGTRTVYNVVPTASLTTGSTATQVFADTDPSAGTNTALICGFPNVLLKYGFQPISTCGDTSLVK